MDDPTSNDETRDRAGQEIRPETPRWVKAFAIATIALLLLVVVVVLAGKGGQHGPGRHMQSGVLGNGYAPPGATEPVVARVR